ncbi:hypothetical protein LMG28727_07470 [Paraburkholderia kirstenboschensis]|nr:hypothetical protein LMG28727_07470 [Paraburkholderia kirstenboschensis]
MRQQYDSFCHRLSDKEPVERVLVKRRESRDERMLCFNRQLFIAGIKQVPTKNACIDLKVVPASALLMTISQMLATLK